MTARAAPVLRVADGSSTVAWYEQLGFEVVHEHRFAPELPLYAILRRGGVELHLSEHEGDAPPGSLAYLWVDDVDALASAAGVPVGRRPWGREAEIVDPDGNRLRIGEA